MQIGPLTFPAVLDDISEPLGDGVEQVGAVVVAAERRARQLDLKLSVRGEDDDPDARAAGLRLRRQIRELMENVDWRKLALPITWDVDPDLDLWIVLGTGDLGETDAGLTFGEFTLALSSYIAGRPGSHRAGRRLDLADRRSGTTPRDTRGLIYSTDFATHPDYDRPLVLPGDTAALMGATGAVTDVVSGGVIGDEPALWRAMAAIDGEVVTYVPDYLSDPPSSGRHAAVESHGAVRVWDTLVRGRPSSPTAADDLAPDEGYGWERVFGPVLSPLKPLAIDNGMCRCVLLGGDVLAGGPGIALQAWTEDGYADVVTVIHGAIVYETSIVELTPERAVIEYRTGGVFAEGEDSYGDRALRVILQRGWTAPRLESYCPTAGRPAVLELDGFDDADNPDVAWVWELTDTTSTVLAAISHADVDLTTDPGDLEFTSSGARFTATDAFSLQLTFGDEALTSEQVGSLSLIDARSVPVLVER